MRSKKVERMEAQLREREEEKREKAKLFNVDEVIRGSKKIKTVYIPELEMTVEYGSLTMGDIDAIQDAEDDLERGKRVLWKMLSKANPETTLEKIDRLPLEVAIPILNRIVVPLGLQAPKK